MSDTLKTKDKTDKVKDTKGGKDPSAQCCTAPGDGDGGPIKP